MVAIAYSGSAASASGSGVGNLPQGTQTNADYAASYAARGVTNVFATTQKTSCYRPENPYFASLGPNDGFDGMSPCNGTANTGEDVGLAPYPTQAGSNPGFPATQPMLVKDHSESDIRVDPTNLNHVIGTVKWFVSAEGYNHVMGFFESWDGGTTFSVQGHVPGYEGWTDNTDPVGAFDAFGNYYFLQLGYQFYYNNDGSHNYQINPNKEPNPGVPAEVIAISVRPHGATLADQWSTNRAGQPDIVASYPAKGREPDKQWIAIDTNPRSPHFDRIYAMWTIFDGVSAVPVASFADARPDGTHTAWSAPRVLPTAGGNPQGDTYLLPHVDGSGTVYTTLTNFQPKQGYCCTSILLDRSTDGGVTYQSVSTVVDGANPPPLLYPNTAFRDGIENTFTVGKKRMGNGQYPLYVAWEDHSTGFGNLVLSSSVDGGATWSDPIQVNDNFSGNVDEFQPNLTAAANGTISVAFYDRRLVCPGFGTSEALGAGLLLDQQNARYAGSLPPYGAQNYCVNSSIQFYSAWLHPIGHNVRISGHTWDPQLNSPRPRSIGSSEGFIGDYFGNIPKGSTDLTTSVSTFDDGSNPHHYQQQVVAAIAIP
jgi:hypothetical protein